jgi:hypothetical protein
MEKKQVTYTHKKRKKNSHEKRLKKFSSLLFFPSTPSLKTQNKENFKSFLLV